MPTQATNWIITVIVIGVIIAGAGFLLSYKPPAPPEQTPSLASSPDPRANVTKVKSCQQEHTFRDIETASQDTANVCNLTLFGQDAYDDRLTQFQRLEELSIVNTSISSLPNDLGSLVQVRFMNLQRNANLTSLPDSVGSLPNLHTLNIADTNITLLPQSLLQSPNLRLIIATQGQLNPAQKAVFQERRPDITIQEIPSRSANRISR